MADQLDCALDLMRRLPPADVEDNLAGLIDLAPDLTEDLLSAVDQPLKIAHDKSANRDYLLCDYNRDADSYRSPWSSKVGFFFLSFLFVFFFLSFSFGFLGLLFVCFFSQKNKNYIIIAFF